MGELLEKTQSLVREIQHANSKISVVDAWKIAAQLLAAEELRLIREAIERIPEPVEDMLELMKRR